MTDHLKTTKFGVLVLTWIVCVGIIGFESSMLAQAALLAGLGAAIAMTSHHGNHAEVTN